MVDSVNTANFDFPFRQVGRSLDKIADTNCIYTFAGQINIKFTKTEDLVFALGMFLPKNSVSYQRTNTIDSTNRF